MNRGHWGHSQDTHKLVVMGWRKENHLSRKTTNICPSLLSYSMESAIPQRSLVRKQHGSWTFLIHRHYDRPPLVMARRKVLVMHDAIPYFDAVDHLKLEGPSLQERKIGNRTPGCNKDTLTSNNCLTVVKCVDGPLVAREILNQTMYWYSTN